MSVERYTGKKVSIFFAHKGEWSTPMTLKDVDGDWATVIDGEREGKVNLRQAMMVIDVSSYEPEDA